MATFDAGRKTPNATHLHTGVQQGAVDPNNLYCSDPNCPYCKELRLAEQLWNATKEETTSEATLRD